MINNNYNKYIHYKTLCKSIVGGKRCNNYVSGPKSLNYSACGVVPFLNYELNGKTYNVAIFFLSSVGQRIDMLDDAAGGVDKSDVEKNMSTYDVASRELFEESAGLLDLRNKTDILKKSMNIYFDNFNPTKTNVTECLYISYFPFLELDSYDIEKYFLQNRKEILATKKFNMFIESKKLILINVDIQIKYVGKKVYLTDIFNNEYECYGKVTSLLTALKHKYKKNNILKYVFTKAINKKHIQVYKHTKSNIISFV